MRKNKRICTNELSRRSMLEPLEERRLLSSIAGTVYEDFNANGIQEAGDALQGDPGVASTSVYIDANDNGVWDPGEYQTLTATDGTYNLTGVPAGNWKLRVQKPSPAASWKFITPAAGFHAVSIPDGTTNLTERDFGLNGPPKLFGPADAQIFEQQTAIDLGNFRDQSMDGGWTITVNWGDGSASTTLAQASAGAINPANHAYADNGQYTVTLTARDQFAISGTATFQVTVANLAPTANLVNSGPILEGQQATISFTDIFDPSSADTAAGFKYSFDFDNDGTYDVVDSTQSFASHLYTENKRQTVTAQIKDKDGGVSTLATEAVINNVAPTLVVSGAATAYVGQAYTVSLSSIDPGEDTIISWIVNWGDGTSSTLGKATQGAHIYAVPGVYTLNVAATDDDSNAGNPYYWAAPLAVSASIAPGAITGTVVNDVDGNGRQGARELGAGNRIVYLDYDYNGLWSWNEPQALTTAAGAYTFTNVAAGNYRVQLAMPKKWLPSSPSTGYQDVYVGSGQTAAANFFMTTRSRAFGTVFLDVNRNRRRDSKDKGLNRWRVYIDANEDGRLNKGELYAYTSSTGAFVLNGLTRGTHVLRVLMPKKGYSLTSPKNEEYILKVSVGQTVKNRNFGTVRIKA